MVNRLLELFEPLLVTDAEPLLFVYDHQAEVAEFDVFGQEPVGSDRDVDLPLAEFAEPGLQVLARHEPAEHSDFYGEWLKAFLEGLKVLERQDRGGSEHR